ncbi:MAG: dihydrofolate reductase [Nocardioidaceae bacterium]|nr:dihydrofolate reductase [Nocardioidaceae bacterium]
MSTSAGRKVTMVAAVAENGVIGADGDIPWRIPADFAHFKAITIGHVLIIGRTTHEGIGRPLPGRTTIVLTRDTSFAAEGVEVAHSVVEALELADRLIDQRPELVDAQVRIGGGAAVYAAALPYADEQVISEIPGAPAGDTHYPDFGAKRWREVSREAREGFTVVWWERAMGCGGS